MLQYITCKTCSDVCRSSPLLSCCIPQLQRHLAVVHSQCLYTVIYTCTRRQERHLVRSFIYFILSTVTTTLITSYTPICMWTLKNELTRYVPTVAEVPGWKQSSQNRRRKEVFPTLEFPTRTILKRRSGGEGPPSSLRNRTREQRRWEDVASALRVISLHAYIHAGLLANGLTPRRRGSWTFLHWFLLLGRSVNIAHHQVYVLLLGVRGSVFLPTLPEWGLGLTVILEQVWEVVLLDGDDPLEVAPCVGCARGQARPIG